MFDEELFEYVKMSPELLILLIGSFILFFSLHLIWPKHFAEWQKRLYVSFGIFPFPIILAYLLSGSLFHIFGEEPTTNFSVVLFGITAFHFLYIILFVYSIFGMKYKIFYEKPKVLISTYALGTALVLYFTYSLLRYF